MNRRYQITHCGFVKKTGRGYECICGEHGIMSRDNYIDLNRDMPYANTMCKFPYNDLRHNKDIEMFNYIVDGNGKIHDCRMDTYGNTFGYDQNINVLNKSLKAFAALYKQQKREKKSIIYKYQYFAFHNIECIYLSKFPADVLHMILKYA